MLGCFILHSVEALLYFKQDLELKLFGRHFLQCFIVYQLKNKLFSGSPSLALLHRVLMLMVLKWVSCYCHSRAAGTLWFGFSSWLRGGQ